MKVDAANLLCEGAYLSSELWVQSTNSNNISLTIYTNGRPFEFQKDDDDDDRWMIYLFDDDLMTKETKHDLLNNLFQKYLFAETKTSNFINLCTKDDLPNYISKIKDFIDSSELSVRYRADLNKIKISDLSRHAKRFYSEDVKADLTDEKLYAHFTSISDKSNSYITYDVRYDDDTEIECPFINLSVSARSIILSANYNFSDNLKLDECKRIFKELFMELGNLTTGNPKTSVYDQLEQCDIYVFTDHTDTDINVNMIQKYLTLLQKFYPEMETTEFFLETEIIFNLTNDFLPTQL